MTCIFRAIGFDFNVNDFLSRSTLKPYKIWRKGEHKTPTHINKASGLQLVASEADMDEVPQQIADSIEFLRLHHDELEKLQQYDGAETLILDFGIEDRNDVLQCDRFPPELLRLAGNLGIGSEITRY